MTAKPKRKAFFLLLASSLLLASCQTDSPSSSEGSSQEDASSIPSSSESPSSSSSASSSADSSESEERPQLNKEILAKRFNEVLESPRYSIKKESLLKNSDEKDFVDTFVSGRYVRLESKGVSHILRANLEDPSLTSSYEFLHEGNGLELLSIDSEKIGDSYAPLSDLSSFNPLSEYVGEDGKGTFASSDFLMSVDEYVINDFGKVLSLAALLNLSGRASNEQFVYATISVDKDDNLNFTLVHSTDGFTFTNYAKGTFLNLGSASSEAEESYFKNPTSPTLAPASSLSSFSSPSYTFTSEIYEHQDSEEWGYLEGMNVLALDIDKAYHKFVYDEHYYAKKDGNLHDLSLNGKNEVVDVDKGKPWSSLVYLKDVLNSKNLMKLDEKTYRYVGSSPYDVFYGLTFARSLGKEDIKQIDFTLNGNKLTHVEVKFNEYVDPTNFVSWDWYAAHIEVSEDVEIALPTPLPPLTDGSAPDIAKTLSYFRKSFQVKLYNKNDPSNAAYVTYSNVEGSRYILREEKTLKPGSLSEYDNKRTGYALNSEGKLVEFLYTSQNEVYALSEPEENNLEDALCMGLSPDVLKKTAIDGKAAYNLRAPIYDLTSSILGYKHLDSVRPMTFHLFYNSNVSKKPLSYEYRYEYNSGQSIGQEIGEFTALGDDEIEVDENLVSKVAGLTSFASPSTWEMEENVYPTLLSFFGEAIAKKIPYVYEKSLFDKWYAITTNIVDGKPTRLTIYLPDIDIGYTDETNYMGRMKEKILALDGVVASKDADGEDVYYLEESGNYVLAIALGKTPKEGIDLYIPQ